MPTNKRHSSASTKKLLVLKSFLIILLLIAIVVTFLSVLGAWWLVFGSELDDEKLRAFKKQNDLPQEKAFDIFLLIGAVFEDFLLFLGLIGVARGNRATLTAFLSLFGGIIVVGIVYVVKFRFTDIASIGLCLFGVILLCATTVYRWLLIPQIPKISLVELEIEEQEMLQELQQEQVNNYQIDGDDPPPLTDPNDAYRYQNIKYENGATGPLVIACVPTTGDDIRTTPASITSWDSHMQINDP